MLNYRLLSAWPNWLVVPSIAVFWLFIGVLVAQLLTSQPKTGK